MDMKGYQQGDVLLVKVDAVPQDAKPVSASGGRFVLAEGEATGHAHAVTVSEGVEMLERGGVLYLSAATETEVEHEEHHAQKVSPGVYEVRRVVEVDPFADEVRMVED
jgi:hypothetical protein